MRIVLSASSTAGGFALPIELVFWCFVAGYVLHILEESTIGVPFVEKMKKSFYPDYSWRKFAFFNTFLMTIEIASVLVYSLVGGNWIIFPLAMFSERVFNGIWHLVETLVTGRFSSGLAASVISWILAYLVFRYGYLAGEIPGSLLLAGAAIGMAITLLMFGSMMLVRGSRMGVWRA